uniref:Putative membrane protein n=1 Tax=Desulfovibrio sp. U5L TaxID=596152 RepID=I2Q6E2_9BACT
MSDLIVVGYDDMFKAEEVRLKLLKMQKEYLVDLEDAVVAVKKQDGKVKLNQMYHLAASGAIGGGFWGALIGLIFLNPILGAVVGAGAGATAGALSDVGIDDDFMKKLAETLKPGTSVLFVLIRKMTADKVLAELSGTGGRVLQTSLSHEDEGKLQAALDTAAAAS